MVDAVSTAATPDVSHDSPARPALALICVCAPSFMLQLDSNIVAVSLPAIARFVHAGFAGIEWVVTAYTLAFATLLLPGGTLADRYGRKTVQMVGLGIFIAASILCGLSTNLVSLVAARALQGGGAALTSSAALASLAHMFRGDARVRAFSIWGTMVGLGMTLGPIVGGIVTQQFGWQWIFYINVPVGLAIMALMVSVLPPSRDPGALNLDVPGALTFAAALFLITLLLIEGNQVGWAAWPIVAMGTGALVFFALFIARELKVSRPMLELAYFRRPTYVGACIAQFSFSFGILTMLTYLPMFILTGLHRTSADTGLMMLPLVVPIMLIPRFVTRRLARFWSSRVLLTLGLGLASCGLFMLTWAAPTLTYAYLIIGMVLTGCGAGLLNGETAKAGMSAIPPERAGMASGTSTTVRFVGIVTGVAALGALLTARIDHALALAMPAMAADARLALVHALTAGDRQVGPGNDLLARASTASIAGGYQAVFLAGAMLMAVGAVLVWMLVRPAETQPIEGK